MTRKYDDYSIKEFLDSTSVPELHIRAIGMILFNIQVELERLNDTRAFELGLGDFPEKDEDP